MIWWCIINKYEWRFEFGLMSCGVKLWGFQMGFPLFSLLRSLTTPPPPLSLTNTTTILSLSHLSPERISGSVQFLSQMQTDRHISLSPPRWLCNQPWLLRPPPNTLRVSLKKIYTYWYQLLGAWNGSNSKLLHSLWLNLSTFTIVCDSHFLGILDISSWCYW